MRAAARLVKREDFRPRRLRPLDKMLLATLLPIWAACFALSVRSAVLDVGLPPVLVSGHGGSDAYPTIGGFIPGMRGEVLGLRLGDQLLRLGDADLRGVGNLEFLALAARHEDLARPVPVVFERAGMRGETLLPLQSYAGNWPLLVVSLVFASAGSFLLLRSHRAPLMSRLFQGLLCIAIAWATKFGASLQELHASASVFVAAACLAPPLALRAVLSFPDGSPPPGRLGRLGPWLFSAYGLLPMALFLDRISPDLFFKGLRAFTAIYGLIFLVVTARTYRALDPIARRQGRWVLWGVYCAILVRLCAEAWLALDPGELQLRAYLWSFCALALVPLALVIAIVRYNLLDVDRLLSATASYNVILVVLVAVGLVLVPRLGQASSALLGLDPGTGQLALSLALAAIVVPAHQRLRPRIERVFFRERHALDLGIAELLRSLAGCEDARALTRRLGEELHRLLRPEACVVYARAGEAFAPVFVEGRAVPPAFEAGSPLIATLAERRKPLALSAAGRTPDTAELGPFDRAALQTLEVEVVVPVRRDALAAFLCLGPKRSGDVYTPTDLSHLAAVAEAVSAQLRRLDQEQVIREARAMQESLRRYVPGAVAEELAAGAELEPGEREVSVLFVDIRGYTSLSEPRGAREIFSTLNRYTERVSAIVREHGGSVVEFNGDGMMAVFGAPRELAFKERAAVEAGREIHEAVGALPLKGAEDGDAKLTVGVGIATGDAFVGNIQAADRMIWSAIGNTTNLAARLQGLARELDAALVIDATTRHALGAAGSDFRCQPALAIRGRRAAQDVYTLPLDAHSRSARTASIGSASAGPLSGR